MPGIRIQEGCELLGVPTSSYQFPTDGSLHLKCYEFMDTADVVVSTLQGRCYSMPRCRALSGRLSLGLCFLAAECFERQVTK